MTKEEILAMEAGERLSELVAERIMKECYHQHWEDKKWSIFCRKCGESTFYHQHSQAYSTDISAAWKVVEKMVGGGYAFCFDWASGKIATVIRCIFEENFSKAESEESEWTEGKAAPEAICKAALLAQLEAGNRSE